MSDAHEDAAAATALATVEGHRQVNYEDVDDIIGIAAELQQLDEDRLSVEELAAVATDLAIPEQYITPALDELRRRRTELLATEREAARRKRGLVQAGAVVGGGVAVLFLIGAFMGQRGLSAALADVEGTRAQVVNVLERQVATRRQWEGKPDSPDKQADISGSENRVRVESKRYNDAAAAYNATARAFPGSLWAVLFGFPSELPPAHQLSGF